MGKLAIQSPHFFSWMAQPSGERNRVMAATLWLPEHFLFFLATIAYHALRSMALKTKERQSEIESIQLG